MKNPPAGGFFMSVYVLSQTVSPHTEIAVYSSYQAAHRDS